MENTSEALQGLNGPLVHGQPTTVSIFSTSQVQETTYLPSLVQTINKAFSASRKARPELAMSTSGRLGSAEEFLGDLIHDPDAFILIITYQKTNQVVATASCRTYLGPPKHSDSPWTRRLEVEDESAEWELKLMATDPDAQGSGLASYMMGTIEAEAIRRTKLTIDGAAMHNGGLNPIKYVRMVLCTVREILEEYYARRGYVRDYEVERGEGYRFHVDFMSKTIANLS